MPIRDVLADSTPSISFEFFPPRTERALASLKADMCQFEALSPSFVSVTYGAGGSTRERTHDLVVSIKQAGILEPVPHLTCIHLQEDQLQGILSRYAAHDVGAILALRGDPPEGDSSWSPSDEVMPYAADLVKRIVSFNEAADGPGFAIGVAGFPEGHPETPNQLKQMDNLRAKVDSGADWITTQMFFDNARFNDWCERCEIVGVSIPKIAGIMPVTSLSTLRRMADLAAGTTFPAGLLRELYRWQDDADAVEQVGVDWAVAQCRDLLEQGVDGLHLYTLNKSDATRRLVEALPRP
ncbi:MAG: methylenetetrahydrofolate reductase [NAD(P)H] [Phycisphaerales bacterium]|nr:methylenetetrahydrofolate reductase [NAD(P)H] [Phycisphaerales bacterium]